MSAVEFELEKPTLPQNNGKSKFQISTGGKILIGLSGGVAIGLSVICVPFVAPAFRKYCLPYVPATDHQVNNVLKLIRGQSENASKRLLDIGSGDGRIVIAAARNGFKADGVELNTWLVQYSRIAAITRGVFSNTRFFQKDLWKFDVSPYNYVVIFGVEQMMEDLEKKFLNEANSGSKIIACRFPLPNLQATKIIGSGIDTVWLYDMQQRQK